jgi:hypothetical protein
MRGTWKMGRGKDYVTENFMIWADQIKKKEMGRSRGTYERQETCEQVFGGGRDGKRPLKGSRRRREDNIKMGVQKLRWGGMHWIALAQDRDEWRALVVAVKNLRVPQNMGKFLSG